jgi:hypothetical protein
MSLIDWVFGMYAQDWMLKFPSNGDGFGIFGVGIWKSYGFFSQNGMVTLANGLLLKWLGRRFLK